MANFGIYASEKATSISTPIKADVGVPIFVGTAPIQAATSPGPVGRPILATSYDEAVAKLGFTKDWKTYTLCECIYSHFQLFGAQPAIFVNVLDPHQNATALTEQEYQVIDHRAEIPFETLLEQLSVKSASEEDAELTIDEDFTVVYDDGVCTIELLSGSEHYDTATILKVSGRKVVATNVNKENIIEGLNQVDACLSAVAIVPDLILAPGYSHESDVAAVMAAKAASISGLFSGKALIDISTKKEGGVTEYSELANYKSRQNLVSEDEIVCWPLVALGDDVYHMSVQLAGLMAITDYNNGGVPYEAASNLNYQMDRAVLEDGTEVDLTLEQANIVRTNGIVTALNFMNNGWVSWGTYTGCAPGNTDIKDYIYPISRTIDFVKNTVIRTFWSKVDRPLTRVLIDNIVTTCNIWLGGLVGSQQLLGARAVLESAENPLTDLMAGRVKIHIYLAPPPPMHECDFIVEYDVNYITEAFSAMMAS